LVRGAAPARSRAGNHLGPPALGRHRFAGGADQVDCRGRRGEAQARVPGRMGLRGHRDAEPDGAIRAPGQLERRRVPDRGGRDGLSGHGRLDDRPGEGRAPVNDARGFTLLEVLLALAILGVAVVASIQGFAQGLRLLKLSGEHQSAVLLADQKIRDIVTPEEGQKNGEDQLGGTTFSWEMVTTPIEAPDLIPTAPGAPPPTTTTPSAATATGTPQWLVYQIAARVRWADHRLGAITTILFRCAPSV